MPFFGKTFFGVDFSLSEDALHASTPYMQFMTGYFCLFILSAVANGFNVRHDGFNIFQRIKENPGFLKIMGIIVVVQVAITLIGGKFFSCTPFGLKGWAIVVLLAVTMIPVDMIRKAVTMAVTKK